MITISEKACQIAFKYKKLGLTDIDVDFTIYVQVGLYMGQILD